jgi:Type VI secretion system/phage-baseplate injector OB domain
MRRFHGGVISALVRERDTRQGRVRVEFAAMEDDLISAWAPIAAPMSGKNRGHLFMPEPGDECLVAFENGNIDHPRVIGFMWNGVDTTHETEPENRVLVTPGGHEQRFEDKKNDTRIILRSKGKHQLTLEDKASGPMARLASNGGRMLTLDDSGTGKAELATTANAITLDDSPAGTKIEISAGHGAVVITLNATPSPSISISAGGNTVDISPGAMSVTAAGTLSITTAGAATINAGGAASITAGGAVSITSGGAVAVTASALTVTSAVAAFTGTIIASGIVSPMYSPGIGNIL